MTVDRCCYDLDGGGDADDGVLRGRRARRQRCTSSQVYEDRDRSRSFTAGDLVRLDRGGAARPCSGAPPEDWSPLEHCCVDFDGGGPADDGLLVIGVPPDRVVMAAIYERRPATPAGSPRRSASAEPAPYPSFRIDECLR